MSAERYLTYLPDSMAELKEFQTLGAVEGEILAEEEAAPKWHTLPPAGSPASTPPIS